MVLYDDNHVQLDGPTSMAWSEDVPRRFDAYGWHTQRVDDGNDLAAIDGRHHAARADDRPSLIAVRTHIGFGSPNKQDSQKAHGAPLGPDEVRLTKEAYGWDPDRTFYVPDDALALFRAAVDRRASTSTRVERAAATLRGRHVDLGEAFLRRIARGCHAAGTAAQDLRRRRGGRHPQRVAGRDPGLARPCPSCSAGAADLSESNLTDVKGEPQFSADEPGRTCASACASTGWAASPTASPTTAGSSRTTRRS